MTNSRIVITGIGLTSPNGNNLKEFRHNLLNGVSGVQEYETRYMGKVLAGVCNFDELKYQKKKNVVVEPVWVQFQYIVHEKLLLIRGSI